MKKVLVANRGEIARRVLRTLKKMNIQSVAIYSDADANAPHVLEADEAVYVGKSPSAESYLQQDLILKICKDLGVDGIHPGYGFLSENSGFARKVKEAGMKLIGPSPESMELMGDKLSAKQAVKEYNVPLVPGVDEAISDIPAAKRIAAEVGYPILIKASAGGGGKGMRLVYEESEFEEQMILAQNEARSSFGDDAVFIEKFVNQPRHIEIQVFADQHGNAVHLFERECSVQRRHQKVIEEAPSAVLTPEIREKMGAAAVQVCKACNYEGAGTVEFLADADENFYFLEMNTRLQVEHPVTEMVTGLDLVEWMQQAVPEVPVAVITAHGNVEAAVRALKLGAFDFVSKPVNLGDLRNLVGAAIKVQSATQGSISDTLETYSKGGATPTILEVPAGGTLTPLAQAIADAITGVIVPARVAIADSSTSTINEGAAGTTADFSVTLTRSGNVDSVVTLKYSLAVGDGVNLEIDTLARYVARMRDWDDQA